MHWKVIVVIAILAFVFTFFQLRLESKRGNHFFVRTLISLTAALFVSVFSNFLSISIQNFFDKDIVSVQKEESGNEETESKEEKKESGTEETESKEEKKELESDEMEQNDEVEDSDGLSMEQESKETNSKQQINYVEDVEYEVKIIKEWYYSTRDNIKNKYFEIRNFEGSVKAYFEESNLVMIEVPTGYNGIAYSRLYYYHDGKLYFAFVFDKTIENRLYFKGNLLIRYIDESNVVHDDNYGLKDCFLYDLVIEESDKMFNNFKE